MTYTETQDFKRRLARLLPMMFPEAEGRFTLAQFNEAWNLLTGTDAREATT